MINFGRKKIGLALGGGGSRGLAHIGVIKTLKKNNLPIDFIAGTSIGAMVGGFYAAGLTIEKIEAIALETDWRKIFSLLDPRLKHGLIGGDKVKKYIAGYVGDKKIEDLKIPFAAIATDLKTGEVVVLKKGEIAQAIRASVSVPLFFKPVEIDGKTLADGGLSAPVPVEEVRAMGADIVIAVNLDKHYHDETWRPGWLDIANNSLDILRHHLARLNSAQADIVIEIDVGKNNYWYQFTDGQDKILSGERAAEKILPRLKKLLEPKNQGGIKKLLKFFR